VVGRGGLGSGMPLPRSKHHSRCQALRA
jgi:hypothetical protein